MSKVIFRTVEWLNARCEKLHLATLGCRFVGTLLPVVFSFGIASCSLQRQNSSALLLSSLRPDPQGLSVVEIQISRTAYRAAIGAPGALTRMRMVRMKTGTPSGFVREKVQRRLLVATAVPDKEK